MATVTHAEEIIDSFESNFADKRPLPDALVYIWLLKAIARFSCEIEEVTFDEESRTFSEKLHPYAIDTMANYMWQLYQEREVSKVNKRVSIVGKDLSFDGSGNSKKYASAELNYISNKSSEMTEHQKPPAYN